LVRAWTATGKRFEFKVGNDESISRRAFRPECQTLVVSTGKPLVDAQTGEVRRKVPAPEALRDGGRTGNFPKLGPSGRVLACCGESGSLVLTE
jgi:hypothetical protein